MGISLPKQILFECRGLEINVETNEFSVNGKLDDFDEYMNLTVNDAQVLMKNGNKYGVEQIFVKGSSIVFIIVPPMIEYSPIFNS